MTRLLRDEFQQAQPLAEIIFIIEFAADRRLEDLDVIYKLHAIKGRVSDLLVDFLSGARSALFKKINHTSRTSPD
jgi:hypothetical protein